MNRAVLPIAAVAVLCALLAIVAAGCAKPQAKGVTAPAPVNTTGQSSDVRAPVAPSNTAASKKVDETTTKGGRPPTNSTTTTRAPKTGAKQANGTDNARQTTAKLPRIVDIGGRTCIPCKQMAPILDALKEELAGKAVVEVLFLDDDREIGKKYGVQIIPTQIFFDTNGKETWRHMGFLGKEDILAKLKEAGMKE